MNPLGPPVLAKPERSPYDGRCPGQERPINSDSYGCQGAIKLATEPCRCQGGREVHGL